MKLIGELSEEQRITVLDLDTMARGELLKRGYKPQHKLGEGSNRNAFKVTRPRETFEEQLVAKVPKLMFDTSSIKRQIAADKQRKGRNWNVQEAIISTTMSHANLARTVDSFFTPDERTINIEHYYEGSRGLRGEIKFNQGGLSLPVYKGIMSGILAGVGHMHANQVVHRDLSPDNVIVNKKGEAVITDLQTAAFSRDCPLSITPTQGRIDYTSPRLVNALVNRKEERATERDDLYSIGAIGYYILTGEEPSSYHLFESPHGSPVQIGDKVVYVSLRSGNDEIKEISSDLRKQQLNAMYKRMKQKSIPKQHRNFILGCMEE